MDCVSRMILRLQQIAFVNPASVPDKEYNRLYMIDKRKADKLGISVAEFRGKK